jgi:7-cyano-7-deazaguanine synthase
MPHPHDPARPTAADGAPAVVLLSGGLDSATCLALATREGFAVHALSFRYGQRHEHEVEAARRIARRWGVARHVVVDIDLRVFGGSALTDVHLAVPKDQPLDAAPAGDHVPGPNTAGSAVPITYVPARNTIFLSYALALAETTGARDVFLGVNALDYSGYPDCRPAYVEAYERMANLATRAGVEAAAHGDVALRLRTPLLHLTKAEIVRLGRSLGVDYGETTSCYDPDITGAACGHCDACQLRLRGFAEAGAEDPAPYADRPVLAARAGGPAAG